MKDSVKKNEALKTLVKIASEDPMLQVAIGKKSVKLDRYVSPLVMIRTEVRTHMDGFAIDTHYGISVRAESRKEVLETINKLNCENIFGQYHIDSEGTLSHRNFCPCGKYVQMSMLQSSIAIGVKMFLTDLAEIMEAVGSGKAEEEDYTIIEEGRES